MNIAIFEDTKEDFNIISGLLDSYKKKENIMINISYFPNTEELLADYDQGKYDAVFLDVYDGDSSCGVEAAKKIRVADEDVKLIFTTTSQDFLLDAFELWATHYLIKPLNEEKIWDAMNRLLQVCENNEKMVSFPNGKDKEINIYEKDIYYIETVRNGISIHLKNEELFCRYPISKAEASLDSKIFLRCHQSYLVNLEKIDSIDEKQFLLSNGEVCMIRQRELARIKQKYFDFVFDRIRERQRENPF